MPGVLMLETLTQVAAALVLEREGPMPMSRVYLHGVDGAKFRRQVVPGDQLRLEVTLGGRARRWRRRAASPTSAIRSSPRRICCSPSCPTACASIRPRSS